LRSLLLAVCSALVVSQASADDPKPSRLPLKGCTWAPFQSRELGVSLLTQRCTDPKAHYVFSARGDWLEMHRPADDKTFGGPRVLRVLAKSPDQDIREAIEQAFIAKLDEPARSSCKVFPIKDRPLKYGRVAYEIRPTGAYAEEVKKRLENEPVDFGCGEYGKQQETVYFEYHPEESKGRYLFVVLGWDKDALFDEQSIALLGDK
jgi:hypothetical protein